MYFLSWVPVSINPQVHPELKIISSVDKIGAGSRILKPRLDGHEDSVKYLIRETDA